MYGTRLHEALEKFFHDAFCPSCDRSFQSPGYKGFCSVTCYLNETDSE